jgi:hypothetical protein
VHWLKQLENKPSLLQPDSALPSKLSGSYTELSAVFEIMPFDGKLTLNRVKGLFQFSVPLLLRPRFQLPRGGVPKSGVFGTTTLAGWKGNYFRQNNCNHQCIYLAEFRLGI